LNFGESILEALHLGFYVLLPLILAVQKRL
jgi:hypothetical protein